MNKRYNITIVAHVEVDENEDLQFLVADNIQEYELETLSPYAKVVFTAAKVAIITALSDPETAAKVIINYGDDMSKQTMDEVIAEYMDYENNPLNSKLDFDKIMEELNNGSEQNGS